MIESSAAGVDVAGAIVAGVAGWSKCRSVAVVAVAVAGGGADELIEALVVSIVAVFVVVVVVVVDLNLCLKLRGLNLAHDGLSVVVVVVVKVMFAGLVNGAAVAVVDGRGVCNKCDMLRRMRRVGRGVGLDLKPACTKVPTR